MKLLLPAREIPMGACVTKRTGLKQYMITDKLIIHGQRVIEYTESDVFFLVDGTDHISVIKGDVEMVWDDVSIEAMINMEDARHD